MQRRNVIVIAVAVALGLLAVFLGNAYFSGYEKRQALAAERQKLSRIVVASQALAFGTPVGSQNLHLVNWPAQSVPEGAFTSVAQLTAARHVVLRPLVAGEPVLASNISGANGRATLSANLPIGKLAFAIPINDVSGVGGFVRPGDIVDVILTRPIPGDGAGANDKMTDVVAEATPVLGVDQIADANDTKATPAKTVTLEVDSLQAQKLALSIQLGQLSLALRNVADAEQSVRPTITPSHLSTTNLHMPRRTSSAGPIMAPTRRAPPRMFVSMPRRTGATMTVVRGSAPSQYEVQHGV